MLPTPLTIKTKSTPISPRCGWSYLYHPEVPVDVFVANVYEVDLEEARRTNSHRTRGWRSISSYSLLCRNRNRQGRPARVFTSPLDGCFVTARSDNSIRTTLSPGSTYIFIRREPEREKIFHVAVVDPASKDVWYQVALRGNG